MRIRFLSSNKHKIDEVRSIIATGDIEVIPYSKKIEEIQTDNVEKIVRDKCLKAFQMLGRPLFVEHTGLFINSMNGFPAGLTEIFWETLQADRVSELFGNLADPSATAKTRIGYCDGRKIHQFEGEILGKIANEPKGPRDFQWDCVFIPDGQTETFAEMGSARKNNISMRKLALQKFATFLKVHANT